MAHSQTTITSETLPVLSVIDGRATALSTDVARHFDKRHANVLRDIDNLLSQLDKNYLLNFEEVIVEYQNGKGGTQTTRAYRLTRDGFTLLAMGFTGSKALQFKLAYIDAFNKMESELSSRRVKPEFQIPQTFSEALRLAADLEEQRAIEEQKRIAAESALAVAEPKAIALERISISSGSLCITDAAKVLQVKPKELFQHLSAKSGFTSAEAERGLLFRTRFRADFWSRKSLQSHATAPATK